jgi:hypothetical protein
MSLGGGRGQRMAGDMAADGPGRPAAHSAVRCNGSLFRSLAQLPQQLR